MYSKITIEVDFDNNNTPVIQVLLRKSDDVRDKLLQSFISKLSGQSSWCTIKNTLVHSDGAAQWIISPISTQELGIQSLLMTAINDIGNPHNDIDEYTCFELWDENECFLGLNIFHNGKCVHTWQKPDKMQVDNFFISSLIDVGKRDGESVYEYAIELHGFAYKAHGKYTISQIAERLRVSEDYVTKSIH